MRHHPLLSENSIVELHSQLGECESLVKETSGPPVYFLYAIAAFSLLNMRNLDINQIIDEIKNDERPYSSLYYIAIYLFFIAMRELIFSLVLHIFPNGIYPDKNLFSKKVINKIFKSDSDLMLLRKEVEELKMNLEEKNLFFSLVIIVFSILLYVLLMNVGSMRDFSYFLYSHYTENSISEDDFENLIQKNCYFFSLLFAMPHLVKELLNYVVKIINDKNIDLYVKKLKKNLFDCTDQEWISCGLDSFGSNMLYLKIKNKNIIFDNKEILGKQYISSLSKILKKNNFNFYSVGSECVFLPISRIKKDKIIKLRKDIINYLDKFYRKERLKKEIKRELFILHKEYGQVNIDLSEDYNDKDKLIFYFSIDKESINIGNEFDFYTKKIKNKFGSEMEIMQTNEYLVLYCSEDYFIPKSRFQVKKPDNLISNQLYSIFETEKLEKQKKLKRSKKNEHEEKIYPVKTSITKNQQNVIEWPLCHARYESILKKKNPNNFFDSSWPVFPLYKAWENKQNSFATIDPRVLEQCAEFLDKNISKKGKISEYPEKGGRERIFEVLERGKVLPKGKIKTKQGNIGICDADEIPYQSCDKKPENARYKIKIGNLRIFCSMERSPAQIVEGEDGSKKVLYIFNGAGCGH